MAAGTGSKVATIPRLKLKDAQKLGSDSHHPKVKHMNTLKFGGVVGSLPCLSDVNVCSNSPRYQIYQSHDG